MFCFESSGLPKCRLRLGNSILGSVDLVDIAVGAFLGFLSLCRTYVS